MDEDKELAIVKNHCLMLSEHFDTVQIFVTRHESNDKGTMRCNFGTGNFYARYGHVKLWANDQRLDDPEEKDGE